MVNKALVALAVFALLSESEVLGGSIRAAVQEEAEAEVGLGTSKVRPIQCPFFSNCDQLFDSSKTNPFFPDGILRDTSLFDVKVTGSWELFFGYDNPTGATMTFSETVKTGFQQVRSSTVYHEWTASAGYSAQGAAISAGYKSSVQQFTSSTWSTETQIERSVVVPAQTSVQIYQRTVSLEFIRKVNTLTKETMRRTYNIQFTSPYTVSGSCVLDGKTYTLTPNSIGCGFNMNNIVFVFRTTCFSAETDITKRDAFCKVEKDQ